MIAFSFSALFRMSARTSSIALAWLLKMLTVLFCKTNSLTLAMMARTNATRRAQETMNDIFMLLTTGVRKPPCDALYATHKMSTRRSCKCFFTSISLNPYDAFQIGPHRFMHKLLLTKWVRFCGAAMLPDGALMSAEQATELGVDEQQEQLSPDTLKDMHTRFLAQQSSIILTLSPPTDSLICYIKCVTAWHLQRDAKEALKFLVDLLRLTSSLDSDEGDEVNIVAKECIDAIFDKADMASILLQIDQTPADMTYAHVVVAGMRTLSFMGLE